MLMQAKVWKVTLCLYTWVISFNGFHLHSLKPGCSPVCCCIYMALSASSRTVHIQQNLQIQWRGWLCPEGGEWFPLRPCRWAWSSFLWSDFLLPSSHSLVLPQSCLCRCWPIHANHRMISVLENIICLTHMQMLYIYYISKLNVLFVCCTLVFQHFISILWKFQPWHLQLSCQEWFSDIIFMQ